MSGSDRALGRRSQRAAWWRSAAGWAAVFGVVALVSYLLAPVAHVLLFAFAGVILAVFLDGLTRIVQRRAELDRTPAYLLVLVVLLVLALALGAFLAPRVAAEVRRRAESLPAAFEDLRDAV